MGALLIIMGAPSLSWSIEGNPFKYIDVGWSSSPAFGDIDGDGDLDMVVGEEYTAKFYYYENTGDHENPTYIRRTGANNPFNGFKADKYLSCPVLADLDGDGDLDLLSGSNQPAKIYYWENTGTATAQNTKSGPATPTRLTA